MTVPRIAFRFALPILNDKSDLSCRLPLFCLLKYCLVLLYFCSISTHALAQKSNKPIATKVTVSEVKTEIIADFAELQGRLVPGSTESVTAVVSAEIELLNFRLGDMVLKGEGYCKAKT